MRRVVYFFKGNEYSRYDLKTDRVEAGWPKKIKDEWEGLFPSGIDAAISDGATRIYFFKGEQYSRYDLAEDRVQPGWPKKIRDEWAGLFPTKIDAAFDFPKNKAYFFKGTDYSRYDMKQDKVEGGWPKKIKDEWEGLFPNQIDAAAHFSKGKVFFFKGADYSRYDMKKDKVEADWPKRIDGKRKDGTRFWRGLFEADIDAAVALDLPELDDPVTIPDDINDGVSFARQQTMLDVFGAPGKLTVNCSNITDARLLRNRAQNVDVGPFRVTGLRPAVEALERIFERVRQRFPDLNAALGTAGMECCRAVRGSKTNFSNHSWGTAIDITIKGKLDKRGDGKALFGLLMLHRFFNEERFFWGAGFSGKKEDAMHFEASDELIRDWDSGGLLAP
jgi:hemopexin/D-alanyl-D-alanine carboxypeptidase-like protein